MKIATITFVLCAILTISMSGQKAKKNIAPIVSSSELTYNSKVSASNLASCNGTLPNYTNGTTSISGRVASQDFDLNYNAYDCQAADDFEAPGIGESTICKVSVIGRFSGGGFAADPSSEIVVELFVDDGGLPGTIIYTENFPGTIDDNNDGDFILGLTGGPELMGGTTYWIGVQAILNINGGQWYWDTATDGNGNPYAWQNPLGGFGLGCFTWSPHTNCSLSPGPDLMMDISFNESLGTNSNSLETAVKIYPNPANNQFTLQTEVSLEKLTIYDLSGRLINNVDLSEMKNEKTIDISSLTSGVYIVRVNSDQGSIVKNLLKQ